MIRTLLRVLGHEHAKPVRRTVALMTTTAIAEGLSYALLVPVLRALFGGTPGDAWPSVIAFGIAVAGYAALRYVSDLSGFRAGTTLLRGMYHRLGDHLARLPIGWFGGGRVGEVSVLAALDPVNEAAVHDGVERLVAGRTVVLVAHRLRTVQRADRVVFLDGGRIVEEGTHDELLRRGGRYAGFWHLSPA